MENELLTCPWCGEQMRFDADSVHCWYKCDNCFSISPKARRLWDDSKTNKENWDINKAKALFLIERSNAKSSRWISVEERLPERGVEVLGTNGKAVEMCTYWPGQPTPWESWTAFHFKPTHWMPLPKPPKESP